MNQMQPHREKFLFYTLVLLWLLPVWTVSYFLTGDGPCHLYNSGILLDWIQGKHTGMYRYFMELNHHLDPNWLTNLIQVPLLAVFPPAIAEKVFYTIYLLGFASGFRFLIRQINPKALYLCSIGLIFAWHHIVYKGFSNNTLSIAIWFWIVGCWLRYKEEPWWKAIPLQMLLVFTGYLAHPMGFIYSGLMIACLLISQIMTAVKHSGFHAGLQYSSRHLLRLGIAYLPALVFLFAFFKRRSWSGENSGYNNEVWENLVKMPALINLNRDEGIFALAVSLFCLSLLVITIYHSKKGSMKIPVKGLLFFMILVFLTIIFPPGSILGGLDVPRRLIMLPFLAILFYAATLEASRKLQSITMIFGTVVTLGLLIIRLPIQGQAAVFVEEVVSCKDSIKPLSTVMTLNYDLEPHNIHGKEIINAEWINVHTDCYLGLYKPLILADNYELNFDYFPFRGIADRNFYYHSGKDGIPFEGETPRVDFNAYQQKTGIRIDYVILTGRRKGQQYAYTDELMQQLSADYELIYTSPHGIAELYHHKSGFKNPWLINLIP